MWTRPSSKRDGASSTSSHRRKSESGSKVSRSRRDRSPSNRSSRADDRDDDARTTYGSVISNSRTNPFDTPSIRSTRRQHEAAEETAKLRRRDKDETSTSRKEDSRTVLDSSYKLGDNATGELKRPTNSSSSKDKARARSYTANEDNTKHLSSESRRYTGASRALDDNTASTVPNQFPGQVPLDYSTSAFEGSGYVGAAADYYGDHGAYLHAVATQPGVRPHTPIVTGTEPHLMAPLAEPAPPLETGAGAALDFYSGTDYAEHSASVNQDVSRPGRLNTSSVLAGAAGLATGAALLGQTNTSSRPSSSRPSSARPVSSKPSKQSSPSSSTAFYAAGAAGAAGLTAAEIHHLHHQQHSQNGKPSSGGYANVPSYATVSNRRKRGPLDTFVDWWKDYEDVRKFEEYTEYIGVCKYCFDPTSTVWEAPRAHRPSRRSSRETQKRTRIDKDTRYHVSDEESRHSKRASLGLAAGAATAITAYGTVQASRSKKDARNYDDYRSRSSGGRDIRHIPGVQDFKNTRTERRSSRKSMHDPDQIYEQQTPSRSRNTKISTSGAGSIGANQPPSSGRRKSEIEMSSASSISSASSDEQPSGFFAKLFSPNATRSKRVRRRRSGRFYGMSNASIDTGLAYGGGASTLSLTSTPSRRKPKRRTSDVDPTKTLLALGSATAALAATQTGSNSRRDILTGRDTRHGIPPPIQRIQKYSRKEQEEGWESASEDDEIRSIDSGLAFGHTVVPSSSSESLSSGASGTRKWNWRWGHEKKKKQSRFQDEDSRPAKGSMERLGGTAAAQSSRPITRQEPGRPAPDSGSRRVSESVSMQVVDPIPISEEGSPIRFDPQRHGAARPILTSPPRDMLIQQPKPRSPPKPMPFAPPGAPQVAPYDHQERKKQRRSSSASPPSQQTSIKPLARVFTEPVKSSSRNVAKDSQSQRRSSSGANLQNLALVGGVAAAAAGVLAMNSKRSDESKNRANRQKASLRDDSDHSEAERLERERRREKRRQDRANQPPAKLPNTHDSSEFPRYVDSSHRSPSDMAVYNKSETTISPSDSVSQVPSRQDYTIEHYEITPDAAASKATEPIFDDDVDDPNFFKKRNRTPPEPRDLDDASKVVNDLTARYAAKPASQAEFFAPTDLLNGPSPLSTREADFDVTDQVHRINSRADPSAAVPRLNIIAPTPPGSVDGRSGRRSASNSPLRRSAIPGDVSDRDFTASRVRWGESEVNVYQVESPESFREPEYFPSNNEDSGDLSKHVPASDVSGSGEESVQRKRSQSGTDVKTGHTAQPAVDSIESAILGASLPSMRDAPDTPIVQSRHDNPVVDQQVSASGGEEQSASVEQDYDWAPITKKSKKDKKGKRKSLDQGKVQTATSGAQPAPELEDTQQGQSQEQGSDVFLDRALSAAGPAIGAEAHADSTEDHDDSQRAFTESLTQGSRIMPGSFDSDEDYPDHVLSRDESPRGNSRTQGSTETPTENTDTTDRSGDVAESSRHAGMDQVDWNETSSKKKKKSKKDKRRNEQSDQGANISADAVPPSGITIVDQPDEWETPASSKKKKKKSTKALKSDRQDDTNEAPETVSESPSLEKGKRSAVSEAGGTNNRSPEGDRANHPKFADVVSSISEMHKPADVSSSKYSGDYKVSPPAAEEHRTTFSIADIVSTISAPTISNGKHFETVDLEDSQRTKSEILTLSEPEVEAHTRKSSRKKSRSYVDTLDLAEVDDYAFHAPSLEKTFRDDSPDNDRKLPKKDKKEKKGIFSFLDKKPTEDLRSSRSSKGSSGGVRDEALAMSESDKAVKRRSTGGFDDNESMASTSHRSQSKQSRRASSSRSRTSTDRRHSVDFETGTKSRTKDKDSDADIQVDLKIVPTEQAIDGQKTAEMTPLPDSLPPSPVEVGDNAKDVVFPLPARASSSTAVPLRFRRPPASPTTTRDVPVDTPVTPESPSNPLRRRTSRPPSTEFKLNHEFRPLYLLESTRRIPEPDENLPSLPSSRTTSRSSSVRRGSDDHFESARESPEPMSSINRGLGITTSRGGVQEEITADILGSGQTTPRAGALSPREDTYGALVAGGLASAAAAAIGATHRSQGTEADRDVTGNGAHQSPDKEYDVGKVTNRSSHSVASIEATKEEERNTSILADPNDELALTVASIINARPLPVTVKAKQSSVEEKLTSSKQKFKSNNHSDLQVDQYQPTSGDNAGVEVGNETHLFHADADRLALTDVQEAESKGLDTPSDTESTTLGKLDPSDAPVLDQFDPFQYMIEQEDQGQSNSDESCLPNLDPTDLTEQSSTHETKSTGTVTEPLLRAPSDAKTDGAVVPELSEPIDHSQQKSTKKKKRSGTDLTSRDKTPDSGWFSSFFGSKKVKSGAKTDKKIIKNVDVLSDVTPHTEASSHDNRSASLEAANDIVLAPTGSLSIPEPEDTSQEVMVAEVPDNKDNLALARVVDSSGLQAVIKADTEQASVSQADLEDVWAVPTKKSKKKSKKVKKGNNRILDSDNFTASSELPRKASVQPASSKDDPKDHDAMSLSETVVSPDLDTRSQLQSEDKGESVSAGEVEPVNQEVKHLHSAEQDSSNAEANDLFRSDSPARSILTPFEDESIDVTKSSTETEYNPELSAKTADEDETGGILTKGRASESGSPLLEADVASKHYAGDPEKALMTPSHSTTVPDPKSARDITEKDHLDKEMIETAAQPATMDDDIWSMPSSRKKDKKKKKNKKPNATEITTESMDREVSTSTRPAEDKVEGREVEDQTIVNGSLPVVNEKNILEKQELQLESTDFPGTHLPTSKPGLVTPEERVDSGPMSHNFEIVDKEMVEGNKITADPEVGADDDWSILTFNKKKGKKSKRQSLAKEAKLSTGTFTDGPSTVAIALEPSGGTVPQSRADTEALDFPDTEVPSEDQAVVEPNVIEVLSPQDASALPGDSNTSSEGKDLGRFPDPLVQVQTPSADSGLNQPASRQPEDESRSDQHFNNLPTSAALDATIAMGLAAAGFDAGIGAVQMEGIDDGGTYQATNKKSKKKERKNKRKEVQNWEFPGDETADKFSEDNNSLKAGLSTEGSACDPAPLISTTDNTSHSLGQILAIPISEIAEEKVEEAGIGSSDQQLDDMAVPDISAIAIGSEQQTTVANAIPLGAKQSKKDKKKKKNKKIKTSQEDIAMQEAEDEIAERQAPPEPTSQAMKRTNAENIASISNPGQMKTINPITDVVDKKETHSIPGFDEIVLAAMGDAGFNATSAVRKTSQERVEENEAVMDFGPASEAVTLARKGKERAPSPSSVWAQSTSPRGSSRSSRRSTPEPVKDIRVAEPALDVVSIVDAVAIKSPNNANSTTSNNEWSPPQLQNRKNQDEFGDAYSDDDKSPSHSRAGYSNEAKQDESSWSFTRLDEQSRPARVESSQEHHAIEPRALGSVESLRENITFPGTPKATVAEDQGGSPAESLTTTKNRSSGLFKSPPSKRNSVEGIDMYAAREDGDSKGVLESIEEKEFERSESSFQAHASATASVDGARASAVSPDVANTRRAYSRPAGAGLRSPLSESVHGSSVASIQSVTPSGEGSRSGTPTLRRIDRSIGSDLRGVSERSELAVSSVGKTDEAREVPALTKPLTPSYQPLKGAGKDRRQEMSEPGSNLEGWGAPALSSPRSSPSRPPSIRKRQSSHILDLERRVDQLTSENRNLQETRARESSGDNFFSPTTETLRARDIQIQEKDVEIHSIKASLETLQAEVSRLTRHNAELQSAQSASPHNDEYALLEAKHKNAHEQWQASSRELEALQQKHGDLSRGMENVVREEIATALAEKDQEIQGLRAELDRATDKIQHLQHQIAQTRRGEEYLSMRDEDYFDSACQQLCQHVQQWVLRYSKFSDTRVCRLSHQVKDERIETRLDNAILDGSDVDEYLSDRVRRRDVFMSVVMTMIWEFVFTRYLFGMDRDQRQKLKALEKTLTEVGPARAVAQWRATTLTLLSRRDIFIEQRAQDTEAVVQEIYSTLARLLPAPSHLSEQIQESLRNVMRLAVNLSIEMRTQRAEYIMLPPLQPEYDTNGELARKVFFNASLMNERSGETTSNEELENQQAAVRLVLFPLVVKKGNDMGESDEEVVVCPAQVLVARPDKEKKNGRIATGPTNASMYSVVPSGEVLEREAE